MSLRVPVMLRPASVGGNARGGSACWWLDPRKRPSGQPDGAPARPPSSERRSWPTSTPWPNGSAAPSNLSQHDRRDGGHRHGITWAMEYATVGELEQLASIGDRTLVVARPHSLVEFVSATRTGFHQLVKVDANDPYWDGFKAAAADVWHAVELLLRRPTRQPPAPGPARPPRGVPCVSQSTRFTTRSSAAPRPVVPDTAHRSAPRARASSTSVPRPTPESEATGQQPPHGTMPRTGPARPPPPASA